MSEISQKLRKLSTMKPRAAAARLTADENDLIRRAAEEIERLEDEAGKQNRRRDTETRRTAAPSQSTSMRADRSGDAGDQDTE